MTAALSDVTMEFDTAQAQAGGAQPGGGVPVSLPAGATAIQTGPGTYEYHLPHTKTIDLIGERKHPS